MKDIFKNKYSIIVLVCIIVAIGIIVVSVCFSIKKSNDSDVNTKNYSKYEKEIINIGREYYEKEYYPLIDNPKEMLKEYKEFGIKMDLEILNNYKKFSDNTTKYLVDNNCNYQISKVIIKPKSNYKVKSYDIDINLECSK